MDCSSFVNDYKTKFIKVLDVEWEYKLYKHMSLTFFFIILEGFEKAGIHDITWSASVDQNFANIEVFHVCLNE